MQRVKDMSGLNSFFLLSSCVYSIIIIKNRTQFFRKVVKEEAKYHEDHKAKRQHDNV